jgi:alpha/beta superfamily hydrolase
MAALNRRDFLRVSAAGLAVGTWKATVPPLVPMLGAQDASLERRREYLRILLELLPPTQSDYPGRLSQYERTWEDWLKRTGELPPDFAAMPSVARLPDPLRALDTGEQLKSVAQWRRQRELMRAEFEQWIFGKMPPPPDNLSGYIIERRPDGDATLERVRLQFGPTDAATLELELLIPPGDGPFPVFLTNHPRRRPWVNTAVRRGYIGCICYALDSFYRTNDDSDPWIEIYPDYDFSAIGRWAWGAMRAVDYLLSHPKANPEQIAISGHSRNSKSALLAAAFDERIGAVAPSRGNTGDQMPWRYTCDMFVSESIEEVTLLPHWFHPRLRFFVGREDKLRVDQNMLLAMVAPRGLILSHAYHEHQGNALGLEQSYRSARDVYRFLGKEENIALYQQPGEHPASVEDVEQYIDFFDTVFGRKKLPRPEIWIHGYSFGEWQAVSGTHTDPLEYPERSVGDFLLNSNGKPIRKRAEWAERRAEIRDRIQWALGSEPPGAPVPPSDSTRSRYGRTNLGWQGQLYDRPVNSGRRVGARSFRYGDDLRGEIYYPVDPDAESQRPPDEAQWPLVIWLHPYSYATGYSRYDYWSSLVLTGFAVVAFDQIGFGARNGHTLRFYDRYPKWSLLGKMIADTRAAIDLATRTRYIDASRVYLCGYALGAKVAMFTAALDHRVAGASAICGFTPLRLDTPAKGTEGIWHYSHLHGLLPRLGDFIGYENRLPIDYDEIIAAIAPRPLQLIAPTMDRYAPVDDVRLAVEEGRKAYRLLGGADALELDTPRDFNRYSRLWRRQIRWVRDKAGVEIMAED